MYLLSFDGERGSERYEICFQSLALSGRQVPIGEWDDTVELLKKLKSIGRPTNKEAGVQLYDLRDSGGAFNLEKAGMKLLLVFLEQPIWRPHVLDQVLETRAWLNTVPNVEPDIKPPQPLVK